MLQKSLFTCTSVSIFNIHRALSRVRMQLPEVLSWTTDDPHFELETLDLEAAICVSMCSLFTKAEVTSIAPSLSEL